MSKYVVTYTIAGIVDSVIQAQNRVVAEERAKAIVQNKNYDPNDCDVQIFSCSIDGKHSSPLLSNNTVESWLK